jgi:hypothetical protein
MASAEALRVLRELQSKPENKVRAEYELNILIEVFGVTSQVQMQTAAPMGR